MVQDRLTIGMRRSAAYQINPLAVLFIDLEQLPARSMKPWDIGPGHNHTGSGESACAGVLRILIPSAVWQR